MEILLLILEKLIGLAVCHDVGQRGELPAQANHGTSIGN